MDPKRIKQLKDLKGRLSAGDVPLLTEVFTLSDYIAAGYKANDLKYFGFTLNRATYNEFEALGRRKDLIAAGFNEIDFDNIGVSANDLKLAGLSCAELLKVGWSASTLRLPQFYGEEKVKAALITIANAHQNNTNTQIAVPVSMLKHAGFTIEELKDAGFRAAQLKVEGAWYTDYQKELVDEIYGAEEVWRELELLESTQSVPVSLEQIGKARNSYLIAVKDLLENRDNTRTEKKKKKELAYRIKKSKEWKDDTTGKDKVINELEKAEKDVEELIAAREDLSKEVKEKRKLLISIIDKRISHLNTQIKFQKKKSSAIRVDVNDKIRALHNAYGPISTKNHEFVQKYYPLNLTDAGYQFRKSKIVELETELGKPETVKISDLKFNERETPTASGGKKVEWYSSEEMKYKDKPLRHLAFLEAKKENIEWIVTDHEAEIELLENVKEIAKNTKSLWRPIASQAVFHTLLGLARYTTTEVGMPSYFPAAKLELSPIKWRRITGKIDFNLEVGASVGAGSSAVATATVGLNVALSGSIAVEDDRRVRVRLSIKLIPNFAVKVHPGGALSVAKASAKFGFTITSQAMAFVDEKHFAHYVQFRIANLLNFQDKLMEYGARGLDYDHDPYSDNIQKIMYKQLGGEKTSKFYEQQRRYLTTIAVVKAHMPISGKIRPTVDLGAESGVIGVSSGISAQMKTPMYFQKEMLAIPDTSSKRAIAEESTEYVGTQYWEYRARGDGDCAYHSLSFLFHHAGLCSHNRPYTVQELRDLAGTKIKNLYVQGRETESPMWLFDDTLYQNVDDYVSWIKSGNRDPSGEHRQWADLPVIAALADVFSCTIHVHQDDLDVIELPHMRRADNKVIHLAYRNANHFNPLIEKTTIEPDIVDVATQYPNIQDANADRPVHFEESGNINQAIVARLDLRKKQVINASEIVAAKNELKRSYTPRIITLGRMGNSMSLGGSVSFESWVNISLEGSLSSINNHINPDNDGKYLNIKTKANLLQRTFAAEPTGEPQVGDPMGRDALGDIWKQSTPPSNLGLNALGSALGPVELKTDFMSRYMEWNYVWDSDGKRYRKQYRRYAYTSGMSIGVSGEVDVYPGIVAGLSFSFGFSKTVTISESIGDNTLTYLQTVFNGLKLRPNGKKQWDAFLKKHSSSLRSMYRKIGKSQLGTNKSQVLKKVVTTHAFKSAQELETLVKDNKQVWQKPKLEASDFCVKKSDEDDKCCFIDACARAESNGQALKISRKDRIKGGLRAKSKVVPNEMEELNERLTTLLWRSGKVLSLYNERMNPFKRKVRYLIPAKGHISFIAVLRPSGIQLTEAPIIHVPRKNSKAEWVRYKTVADIWLNPSLRNADDALAFYQAGFLIDLKIKLPHGKMKTLSIHPMGSVAADNDKDNNELIQQFFMECALDSVNKRKGNLDAFAALTEIDPDLKRIFTQWITLLGDDTFKIRKRLKTRKIVKAKENYPIEKAGMELFPNNKSLLVFDGEDQIKTLAPSVAKDDPESQEIKLSDSLKKKYGGSIDQPKQEVLKDKEKWICKANLLWEEWLAQKQQALSAETGGTYTATEIILTKIKGPFPGYSDDNDFYLASMESLLP